MEAEPNIKMKEKSDDFFFVYVTENNISELIFKLFFKSMIQEFDIGFRVFNFYSTNQQISWHCHRNQDEDLH